MSSRSRTPRAPAGFQELLLEPGREGATTVPVGLVFPSTWRVAGSNLGFHHLYRLLARDERISVRRYVLSPGPPGALEDGRPLGQCQVVLVCLPWELDYVSLLTMLRAAGIAPLRTERADSGPLIVAGGVAVTGNPLPLADFVDAFVLGEVEPVIGPLLDAIAGWDPAAGAAPVLERLADLSSCWVPAVDGLQPTRAIQPARAADLNACPAHSAWLSPDTEFRHTFLVEINRGCHCACRFCLLRSIQGSARFLAPERCLQLVDAALAAWQDTAAAHGVDWPALPQVGLVGAGVASAQHLLELCRQLVDRGLQVGASTLEMHAVSPELLEALQAGGQRTLTLAPERPLEAQRYALGKRVSDDRFFELARLAGQAGFARLKVYFVTGLVGDQVLTETGVTEEAHQLRQFVSQTRAAFGAGGSVAVTVTPFIPKAGADWQGRAMTGPEVLKKLNRLLERELGGLPGVEYHSFSADEALEQGLCSQGGVELGAWLLAASQPGASQRAMLRRALRTGVVTLLESRFGSAAPPWAFLSRRR